MKIYSWNMLFRNRELDRALEFVSKSDFDIFCLQEVPEAFLTRLKTLPFSIFAVSETERLYKGQRSTQYVVILSRYPLRMTGEIPLPFRDSRLPLRGKLFVRIMFVLRLWAEALGNRNAAFADIETPAGIVRIFNLHLALTHPAWRLKEFELAMAKRDASRPTIVCGDFNILEKPHITPISWLLGGKMSDMLLYRRERTVINKRFVEHELINPLAGGVTHPLSQSQLDHILVSSSLSIKNASVLRDRIGSDHHPICVEIS